MSVSPKKRMALVALETDGCGLFSPGDRMIIEGREVVKGLSNRICCEAIVSMYPALRKLAEDAEMGGAAGRAELRCAGESCEARFAAEPFLEAPAVLRVTRRMERGARRATQMMKAAGPFLSRLPARVAQELVGAATMRRFGPGELILEQGRTGENLYIVGEGEVEVLRLSPDDRAEVVLVALGKGECFGEMSLLTGEPTSAAVRSRGHSTILLLDRESLEVLLARHPDLGRAFSKLLADRLKATNVSLESELDRGIMGKLSLINIVDLVQTLNASRRTGTLTLSRSGVNAVLSFREGRLIGTRVGDEEGEAAFYGLMAWSEGDFFFEQGDIRGEGNIRTDTMALLMEGLRRLDEARGG